MEGCNLEKVYGYDRTKKCPECYGWGQYYSECSHDKYVCRTCGRSQCMNHWKYPMLSREETLHFLKAAQQDSGKKCFIRPVVQANGSNRWKIFTDEEDYQIYLTTGKHKR